MNVTLLASYSSYFLLPHSQVEIRLIVLDTLALIYRRLETPKVP